MNPTRKLRVTIPQRTGELVLALALGLSGLTGPAAWAQTTPPAIERMLQPGPEAERLVQRAGTWNVVIMLWPAPDAQPIVWRDLVAERRMVGLFLEEVIRPAAGSRQSDFRRVSYLTYNKVQGRWEYVSMDTRFPAGIMPATSIDRGNSERITLEFESVAFPGWGEAVDGWMLRSSYELDLTSNNAEVARQHWTRADGTGRRWLGVQFDYTRQR